MLPFVAQWDAYHASTRPRSWLESLVKAYLGDGLAADFYREIAGWLPGPTGALVQRVLADTGHSAFAEREVRAACAQQPPGARPAGAVGSAAARRGGHPGPADRRRTRRAGRVHRHRLGRPVRHRRAAAPAAVQPRQADGQAWGSVAERHGRRPPRRRFRPGRSARDGRAGCRRLAWAQRPVAHHDQEVHRWRSRSASRRARGSSWCPATRRRTRSRRWSTQALASEDGAAPAGRREGPPLPRPRRPDRLRGDRTRRAAGRVRPGCRGLGTASGRSPSGCRRPDGGHDLGGRSCTSGKPARPRQARLAISATASSRGTSLLGVQPVLRGHLAQPDQPDGEQPGPRCVEPGVGGDGRGDGRRCSGSARRRPRRRPRARRAGPTRTPAGRPARRRRRSRSRPTPRPRRARGCPRCAPIASRTRSTRSSAQVVSSARYSSSLPGKCW